jgi:hypothetical protein
MRGAGNVFDPEFDEQRRTALPPVVKGPRIL